MGLAFGGELHGLRHLIIEAHVQPTGLLLQGELVIVACFEHKLLPLQDLLYNLDMALLATDLADVASFGVSDRHHVAIARNEVPDFLHFGIASDAGVRKPQEIDLLHI